MKNLTVEQKRDRANSDDFQLILGIIEGLMDYQTGLAEDRKEWALTLSREADEENSTSFNDTLESFANDYIRVGVYIELTNHLTCKLMDSLTTQLFPSSPDEIPKHLAFEFVHIMMKFRERIKTLLENEIGRLANYATSGKADQTVIQTIAALYEQFSTREDSVLYRAYELGNFNLSDLRKSGTFNL